MLWDFYLPVSWTEIIRRTMKEVIEDNCASLAAQLAYYFLLSLFPALLFLVAVASFFPIVNLADELTRWLGPFVPGDILKILQSQLQSISNSKDSSLLTLGLLGTLWSSSAAVLAIVDTVNRAYDITETRRWWKVRLIALGLTIVLALFVMVSLTIIVIGPTLVERLADVLHLGRFVAWVWMVVQWPLAFCLAATAIGLIYYFAPDAEQEWVWITPGSLLATTLWLLTSIGFKLYVARFADYNETYGAIGGVIILLLWFYLTGLAILVGAELNAEIEHASPHGKAPGERRPGERRFLGRLGRLRAGWRQPPHPQPAAS